MENNNSIIYTNRGISKFLSDCAPDKFKISPSPDHVLCRDLNGNPTAVYGGDKWDFNPYRLSERRIPDIIFSQWVECHDAKLKAKLVDESKFILYVLMYHSGSGRTGKTSASTLQQYALFLRAMSRFCVETLENDLAKGLTIFDVLSNASYLVAFLNREDATDNQRKLCSSLLSVLNRIEPEVLGFSSCPKNVYRWTRRENKQHPVIPSRLYIEIINHYELILSKLVPHIDKIKMLIIDLDDRLNGLALATQKELMRGNENKKFRPTMPELIKSHGLEELMYEIFPMTYCSRAGLESWILRVQFLLKNAIHLYTGMRHEECVRLKFDCLGKYEASAAVLDGNGGTIDPSRMVNIVSTTTKFSGYKKYGNWIAPDLVVSVITAAKSIMQGLASLHKVDPKDCPIFLSPHIIRSVNAKITTSKFENKLARGGDPVISSESFRITKQDLQDLSYTDPDRDFSSEPEFAEGEFWPLSSHQFRRSLAFYAANSGFVSMGTVSAQFKHLSKAMTQYYSRHHESLLSVFGEFDEKRGRRVIAQSHVAHEFQMAIPTNAVELLFQDVFNSESTLMGGTGSSLEKLKRSVQKGEISIHRAKDETLKMAERGEISYRRTLVGGCTKVGHCDEFMLGDLTACLSCPGANIRDDKLEQCLSQAESEMETYPSDSAEYQLAKIEADKLTQFRQKKLIKTVEV